MHFQPFLNRPLSQIFQLNLLHSTNFRGFFPSLTTKLSLLRNLIEVYLHEWINCKWCRMNKMQFLFSFWEYFCQFVLFGEKVYLTFSRKCKTTLYKQSNFHRGCGFVIRNMLIVHNLLWNFFDKNFIWLSKIV